MNNIVKNINIVLNPFSKINNDILLNNSFIDCQNEEIKKTENILTELKTSLSFQKDSLKIFCGEAQSLKDEINKLSEQEIRNVKNLEAIESERITSIQDSAQNISLFHNDKLQEENSPRKQRRKFGDFPDLNLPETIIKISEFKNNIIFKIFYINGYFILGGSNGLLVRYKDNEIHIYETNTESIIMEIKVMPRKGLNYFAAFMKENILIYKIDKNKPDVIRDVPGLYLTGEENIRSDNKKIYITNKDGNVKVLTMSNLKIIYLKMNHLRNVKCIFRRIFQNMSFLVLEDSFLYHTKRSDFTNLTIVSGVKDVKSILVIDIDKLLCYSNDTIWILNHECLMLDKIILEDEIKYLHHYLNYIFVVDDSNSLIIYAVNDNKLNNVYKKKMKGNVTSITIRDKKVYIAVADEIIIIDFKSMVDII